MALSFLNLERLRILSACTVLMLAAVTVSSILSTIQMMKPIRILMERVPIAAEYHPAKIVVSYKTFAPDGSLKTVIQDSVERRHRNLVDDGHALDQVRDVWAVCTVAADLNCRPLQYVLYCIL
jgi:hypothetical protein